MGLPLILSDSSRGFPREVQHLRLQITYDRILTSPYHITGTGHMFCAVTSLQHGQASLATLEAVVTVSCTSDDGCV